MVGPQRRVGTAAAMPSPSDAHIPPRVPSDALPTSASQPLRPHTLASPRRQRHAADEFIRRLTVANDAHRSACVSSCCGGSQQPRDCASECAAHCTLPCCKLRCASKGRRTTPGCVSSWWYTLVIASITALAFSTSCLFPATPTCPSHSARPQALWGT